MERSLTARFQPSEGYRRPRVVLNAAMTLDGRIATKTGDSHVSSSADLTQLHRLRARVDAVMIGIGTQLSDNPRLTVRRAEGRNPVRIVVDSLARTPLQSNILAENGKTIVAISRRAPRSRVAKLQHAGAEIITCGLDRVNLRALLAILYRMRVRRILLEGGGELNWSMLFSGLVDELRITIAPFVVGGIRAISLVEGAGVRSMSDAIKLSLKSTRRIGEELMLIYRVDNH